MLEVSKLCPCSRQKISYELFSIKKNILCIIANLLTCMILFVVVILLKSRLLALLNC